MPPLLWAAIRFEFKGAAFTSFLRCSRWPI
jgi:integral membrane sensor domain MASE1